MPVSNQELTETIMRPIEEACRKEGICEVYLAKKLKKELNAKEIKVFNPKGNNKPEGLIYSKALVAWEIRQRARMDVQKLLGLYPIEKREISGSIDLRRPLTPEEEEYLQTAMEANKK
jgi:CMP-2-keto-3-deoxyoctulosonic acid synthetase